MNQIYRTIGISKQAIHQYAYRQYSFDRKIEQLVLEADELRAEHPGCGVEKMYYTLKPDFIGRDRFIDLFMQLGYRVNRVKNYRRTTIASNIYYPNLIKGLTLSAPSTVWQSDITYIDVDNTFYYGVFILDVYTRKIVGYQVSNHMRATANVQALKMALKDNPAPQIHHSDRGSQYTYKEYIKLLQDCGSEISMGLIAQDNAYAERIHRTIKNEYLNYWMPHDFKELKRYIYRAVNHYNTRRQHRSLNRMIPVEFEKKWSTLQDHKKPEMTIFNNELFHQNGQH
jgi:hypothetical protein